MFPEIAKIYTAHFLHFTVGVMEKRDAESETEIDVELIQGLAQIFDLLARWDFEDKQKAAQSDVGSGSSARTPSEEPQSAADASSVAEKQFRRWRSSASPPK